MKTRDYILRPHHPESIARHTTPVLDPGLSSLLDNTEKWELTKLAKLAYAARQKAGALDPAETEEAFRHRIAIGACGRRISEAIRDDYPAIEAALAALAGDIPRAWRAGEKDGVKGKRIAEDKLRKLLASQGRDISYSYPIFQSMLKTTLADATAGQVWKVYYSLNGSNAQRASRLRVHKAKSKAKADLQPMAAATSRDPF